MTEQAESRSIDLSVEVPGTPEEVWRAVATGPGVTSWFTRSEIDARAGGSAITDFGSFGKEESTVVVYEAPHRFKAESRSARADGRTSAVEWLVEARDGGSCVVRLVHSGFGVGEEWDGDFDGMTEGWRLFLENLRLHLTHFRGESGQPIVPSVAVAGPHGAAWQRLCAALGGSPDLEAGDRFEALALPRISGVVQHAQRTDAVSDYILLLDGELRGTVLIAAEGKGDTVMLSVWVYVYDRDPSGLDQELSAFLADNFEPLAPAKPS